MDDTKNALEDLAERLGEITSAWRPSELTGQYAIQSISYVRKAQSIVAELAKVNHGEASPTPWRAHTAREVRANDERLWIKDVVCQTQSCPKTRYTKAEREEWNIPATANTKLIVASVNVVAKCRAIAEEGV